MRSLNVEIGPHGELLAAQPKAGIISVFASDGTYLRTVGRRGQGPGEFQVVGRMGWLGDTLWVVDFGRLQLFDANLEFIRSVTFPTLRPPSGVTRVMPGPILADGSILGIPFLPEPGRAAPILKLSTSGAITDTLAHVSVRDPYRRISVTGSPRPGNIVDPGVVDALWVSEADGRSVVVVDRPLPERASGGAFTITRIGLHGDTLAHRTIEYVPKPVSADQASRWYASMAATVAKQLSVPVARAESAVREAIHLPRYQAPVGELVAGRDGTIWLRREDSGGAAVDWQVFDQAAQPLARVSLPAGFKVQRADAAHVWGVEKDSLDVPFVRVYDLSQPGR